jgi:hypothetical protein
MKTNFFLLIAAVIALLYWIVKPTTAATTVVSSAPKYPSQGANNAAITTGVSSVLGALIKSQPSILTGNQASPVALTNSSLLSGDYEYTSTQAELANNPNEQSAALAAPSLSPSPSTTLDLSSLTGGSGDVAVLDLSSTEDNSDLWY